MSFFLVFGQSRDQLRHDTGHGDLYLIGSVGLPLLSSHHDDHLSIFFFTIVFAVRMLRKTGFVSNSTVRPSHGLGIFVLVLLWVWKLSSPASLPILGIQPRLNTSWHEQIAQELATDKTGLTGVVTPLGTLDRTRVALLIEDRPLPYLIPLLLQFISVVPPEWSFRFMGSAESLRMMESNPTIRRYIDMKKLFLDLIPYNLVSSIDVSIIPYSSSLVPAEFN